MSGTIDRRELTFKALAGLIGGAIGWVPVEIANHGHSLTQTTSTGQQVGEFISMALMAGLIGGMILAAEGNSLPFAQRPAFPFVSIDVDGVGEMVRIAAEKGRSTKNELKMGICGEHGGDPSSISFCEQIGLDYVSCSPFRVPVARLAAAQAALGVGLVDRTA